MIALQLCPETNSISLVETNLRFHLSVLAEIIVCKSKHHVGVNKHISAKANIFLIWFICRFLLFLGPADKRYCVRTEETTGGYWIASWEIFMKQHVTDVQTNCLCEESIYNEISRGLQTSVGCPCVLWWFHYLEEIPNLVLSNWMLLLGRTRTKERKKEIGLNKSSPYLSRNLALNAILSSQSVVCMIIASGKSVLIGLSIHESQWKWGKGSEAIPPPSRRAQNKLIEFSLVLFKGRPSSIYFSTPRGNYPICIKWISIN